MVSKICAEFTKVKCNGKIILKNNDQKIFKKITVQKYLKISKFKILTVEPRDTLVKSARKKC